MPSLILLCKSLCHLQSNVFQQKRSVWRNKWGRDYFALLWKGLSRVPHSSFPQLNWMAPLISSEMWWITKLPSSHPIERGMPRGKNRKLGLAVPFPSWDELLAASLSPPHLDSPFCNFLTLPECCETPFFKGCSAGSFALWKSEALCIVTLFFSRNSLADISSRTATMSVLSYHSLSLTCPVSFLADHSKSKTFGVAQIIFQTVLSQFRAGA